MIASLPVPPITPEIADYIGLVGMALIIVAYAYQTAKDDPNPFIQHLTNLGGAILLIVSLLVHMNFASFVLEVFWVLIAGYGLVRALLARKKSSEQADKGPGA